MDGIFARLTRLAARLLHTPIACIALLEGEQRQVKLYGKIPEAWTSAHGQTLIHTFCSDILAREAPLISSDVREHPLACNNPALGSMGMIAFLGVPLITSSGTTIGIFCVTDGLPRVWSDEEISSIEDIATMAITELELCNACAEQSEIEKKLQESETHYRTLVEKIPLSIYEIDRDGQLLSINYGGLRLMGVQDGDDLCGKAYLEVIPEPNRAYMATLLTRAFSGETLKIEHTAVNDDGVQIYVTSLIPLTDDHGTVHKLMGITQDITERRQIELDAEVERYRLDAILESSSDAILMIDLDGQIVLANKAFCDFFGIVAEAVLGKTGEKLITELWDHFDQPEPLLFAMQQLLAKPQSEESGELLIQRPIQRVLSWYSVSVHTRASTSMGQLFTFRDITQEKQIAQMKSELISIISHELRAPLTAIKGFTDLILDGEAGEITTSAREFLEIVKDSTNQLVTITNNILDETHIKSGKIKLNLRPLAIAEVVDKTARSIQALLESKRQTLIIDLPADLPLINADEEYLIRILNNLLSNAHKYTPAQGRITIRARMTGMPGAGVPDLERVHGSWLVIEVIDTGIGIAPVDQELLFTRFYRVSRPETQFISGTGLGLSITKALVELHRGKIWVQSELNSGSTFAFCLPIFVSIEESPSVQPAAEAQLQSILLLTKAEQPDRAPSYEGHQHVERSTAIAATLQEAVALARQGHAEIIITTLEADDSEEGALIEQLRTDPNIADIPIIAIAIRP